MPYTTIAFFIHYNDWRWRTIDKVGPLYYYQISKGDSTMVVVRNSSIWNVNFKDNAIYAVVRDVLAKTGSRSVAVFSIDQFQSRTPRTIGDEESLRRIIGEMSLSTGLHPERLLFEGGDSYAEFGRSSTLDQGAAARQPSPRLDALHPAGTSVGVDFSRQPDGTSAISATGSDFQPGAAIVAGGRRLVTTFGNSQWLTAIFPRDLYGSVVSIPVQVENPGGAKSNVIVFGVRP